MKRIDFSEIVQIVIHGERGYTRFRWELGDALIRAIGRPSPKVRIEGSYAQLEACAEELERHGFEYETASLRNLWQTAAHFPKDLRKSLPWHVHHIAGSPEMLDTI